MSCLDPKHKSPETLERPVRKPFALQPVKPKLRACRSQSLFHRLHKLLLPKSPPLPPLLTLLLLLLLPQENLQPPILAGLLVVQRHLYDRFQYRSSRRLISCGQVARSGVCGPSRLKRAEAEGCL